MVLGQQKVGPKGSGIIVTMLWLDILYLYFSLSWQNFVYAQWTISLLSTEVLLF